MNRIWAPAAALAYLVTASIHVSAHEMPPPPPQVWSAKGEAGYVMSRGIANTDSANAKVDLADVVGIWKHSIHLEGLYGRSDEITSAERWAAIFQSDFKITPRAFGFDALHFLQDEFSDFQYQASVTIGVSYRFLDAGADKLTAQVGAGERRTRNG